MHSPEQPPRQAMRIDPGDRPELHRASARIANRLVFLIQPLLRSADARDIALREAYAIAREEIERHGAAQGETAS
jgi:hypothetical protein